MFFSKSFFILLKIIIICFSVFTSFGQNNPEKASHQAEKLYDAGKFKETIAFCTNAIKKSLQAKKVDSLELMFLAKLKGYAYFENKQYSQSLESYNFAISNSPNTLQGKEQKSIILFDKAYALFYLDKRFEAYKSVKACVNIMDSLPEPSLITYIDALSYLSVELSELGNYEKALQQIDKALKIYKENKEVINKSIPSTGGTFDLTLRKDYVSVLRNKLSVQFDFQSLNKLRQLSQEAIAVYQIRKQQPNAIDDWCMATIYESLAQELLNRKNISNSQCTEAISLLTKAKNITDPVEFKGYHLTYNTLISRAYYYKGDYNKALDFIENVLSQIQKESYNYTFDVALKGLILHKLNRKEEADSLFFQTLKYIHDSSITLNNNFNNFSPSEYISEAGLMLNIASELEEAENTKATDSILNVLYSLSLTQTRKVFEQTGLLQNNIKIKKYLSKAIIGIIDRESDNLFSIKSLNDIINDTENIENRLAWQQFNQSREVVQLPLIDSLEQVEFKLRKQLVAAKKQRQLKQQDSLQDVLSKHNRLLEKNYPKLAQFTQDNFEITEFQRQIQPNEVVLKYLFFEDEFAVFQITKDSIQWQLKPWTETEQNILKHHLKVIKNPLEDLSIVDNLTNILLPNKALNYKTLTIIPDAPIYNLPFETLVYDKAYLVKTHAVRYSSHLRFAYLQEDDNNQQKNPTVSIFAPEYPKDDRQTYATRSVPYYLEGAQQEAKAIAQLFPSKVFIGKDATKTQFIANKSKGTILHMAMHATIDELNPEFSHFNFPNEQQLHVEELYALKIPADLAVLSACNTGVGKVDNASGMASLQRALNFAGTKATVASLWEVPDQTTSEIMISFYKHLKKGYSKSEALQTAKLEFLENPKNEDLNHPYYWAGFVLYGDDSAVAHEASYFWWYVVGIGLLFALLLLIKRLKQSKDN